MTHALLPIGCYDLLPPYARQESDLSSALLGVFESFGYEQVSPPLLEYSDHLLAGRGASLSSQIFRVMDPAAHRVMGIRTDITLQIARIAASRLAAAPRPLRLCYNGLILRMQGERLKGDRQLRQAGIELIGANSPDADAEVIMVAAQALAKAGIRNFSIDLSYPAMVASLLVDEKLDNETLQQLLEAVSHKDVSRVSGFNIRERETLVALLQSAGPADTALERIDALALRGPALQQYQDLKTVIALLAQAKLPGCSISVDLTENRGHAYHSGVSFSIFVPGAACEVGRGGRYHIGEEEATGFTLYVETLRSVLPAPSRGKRVFLPAGTPAEVGAKLRAEGYVTLQGLSEFASDAKEAEYLGCDAIWQAGALQPLKPTS